MKLTAEDHVVPVHHAMMKFRIKVKMKLTVEDHALLVVRKQHCISRNRNILFHGLIVMVKNNFSNFATNISELRPYCVRIQTGPNGTNDNNDGYLNFFLDGEMDGVGWYDVNNMVLDKCLSLNNKYYVYYVVKMPGLHSSSIK